MPQLTSGLAFAFYFVIPVVYSAPIVPPPAWATRPTFADVVLIISLAASNDTANVAIAEKLIHHLSTSLTLGPDHVRLAVVVNVNSYRTRVLVSLINGTSRHAFAGVEIRAWETTDRRLAMIKDAKPIFDRVDEDVLNARRSGSGDREEAPNFVIFFAIAPSAPWPPLIDNVDADVIVFSTGLRHSMPSPTKIYYKDSTRPKGFRNVALGQSMQRVARMIGRSLAIASESCPHVLEREECAPPPPSNGEEPCPCFYNITVKFKGPETKYCPNAVSRIPCDHDRARDGCRKRRTRRPAPVSDAAALAFFFIICLPTMCFVCFFVPSLTLGHFAGFTDVDRFDDETEENSFETASEKIVADAASDAAAVGAGTTKGSDEEAIDKGQEAREAVQQVDDAKRPRKSPEKEWKLVGGKNGRGKQPRVASEKPVTPKASKRAKERPKVARRLGVPAGGFNKKRLLQRAKMKRRRILQKRSLETGAGDGSIRDAAKQRSMSANVRRLSMRRGD